MLRYNSFHVLSRVAVRRRGPLGGPLVATNGPFGSFQAPAALRRRAVASGGPTTNALRWFFDRCV
jgi:hypothetical protein